MNTKTSEKRTRFGSTSKVELEVCLGQAGTPIGKLNYVKDGQREFSQFAYQEAWLINPVAFDISPDLSRILGYQWQLSPAFDLNPFPDKDRESKTWLSEDTGPITSIAQLLGQASRFQLNLREATTVLAEVVTAVKQWRDVALTPHVGFRPEEIEDFAPAFEHAGLDEAIAVLA